MALLALFSFPHHSVLPGSASGGSGVRRGHRFRSGPSLPPSTRTAFSMCSIALMMASA